MRLKKDKLVPVVVLAGLTLWLLLSGLKDRALDTFRYSVVAGGFDGPTSISYLRLNKTIGFPLKGYISGGEPDRTIFGSSMGLYKPEPVPYQVDARWFSYQTEQFYRIKLEIPEKKQQAIRDFYRQYPERNHTHSLQLGISGEGDLRLYWQATCYMVEGCPSEPRKQLEIYDRAPGTVEAVDLTTLEQDFLTGLRYVYRRERMLCDGLFEGEPTTYTVPDDFLPTSDKLDSYRWLQVKWFGDDYNKYGGRPFTYQLEHRDGTVTSGTAVLENEAGLVEWEDPYNPPYRMKLKDINDEPVTIEPTIFPVGIQGPLTGRINEEGYIYLDQRFLLPSREHFEWPEWAKKLRWQDLRGECKITTYMRLRDTNGDFVAGGVYELIDNETGEVLLEGRTDMQGFTRVRSRDYHANDWTFR